MQSRPTVSERFEETTPVEEAEEGEIRATPLPTGVVLRTAHSTKLTGTSQLDISS